MDRMEDKILVEKVLKGDRTSFSELVKRYQRLVSHMVAKLVDDNRDREEVAQDIFVKIYQKLGDFNFQSKLSTWIATISYRHSINYLKKSQRYKYEEDIDLIEFNTGAEDNSFENEDFANFIHDWIDKLPIRYRTILTLYHLEDMSYPEIVEVMQMPEGTVKNYLFRARKKLRELLEPHMDKEIVL